MAILVRRACDGCGSYDTRSRGGWLRCNHCKSLVGRDAASFLDSEAYTAHVKRAMEPGYAERWRDYQTLLDQAAALGAGSEWNAAFDAYRVAQRWLIDVLPSQFPPEVLEDARYSEREIS